MPSAHTLTDTFYHTLTHPIKKQHTCAHVSIFACVLLLDWASECVIKCVCECVCTGHIYFYVLLYLYIYYIYLCDIVLDFFYRDAV